MSEAGAPRFRVAIIYMCTGRYALLWPGFFMSAERHFLPGHEIHYYVFTDADRLLGEAGNARVHRVPLELRPWPDGTLHRFAYLLEHEGALEDFDYIFYMNSNLEVMADIEPYMILPVRSHEQTLVVVQHPGYAAFSRAEFPYETRPQSLACVNPDEGHIYVCGGINGGTSREFLRLARELDRRIADDESRGVIAAWHDESHLNRYIIDREDVRVLPPSFCFPVGWEGQFPELIRLREKTALVGEAAFKGWATEADPSALAAARMWAGRAARRVVRFVRSGG